MLFSDEISVVIFDAFLMLFCYQKWWFFWYFLEKFGGFGGRGAPGPSLGSIWGCIWGAQGGSWGRLGVPRGGLGSHFGCFGGHFGRFGSHFDGFGRHLGASRGPSQQKYVKIWKTKKNVENVWIFVCFCLLSLACTLAFLSRFPFLAIQVVSSK